MKSTNKKSPREQAAPDHATAVRDGKRFYLDGDKVMNTLTKKEINSSTQHWLAVSEEFKACINELCKKERDATKDSRNLTIMECCDSIQAFLTAKGMDELEPYFLTEIGKRVPSSRTRETKAEIEEKAKAEIKAEMDAKLSALEEKFLALKVQAMEATMGGKIKKGSTLYRKLANEVKVEIGA